MVDIGWKNWSDWLREGHFISYVLDGSRYYEHVIMRDLAHYVYPWHETINASTASGPLVPTNLVVTKGYDSNSKLNYIWQLVFGIKGQVYIYVELPSDIHRHGIPKVPKPSPDDREVSSFEEWMSPFHEPSFITEHIMMKPGFDRMALSAYNPSNIAQPNVYLNFIISRMVTERIGSENYSPEGQLMLNATKSRWTETLDKLHKRQIPHRPLTLMPVRAPAAEE